MSFSFLCHPAPGRSRSRGSPTSVSLPYGETSNHRTNTSSDTQSPILSSNHPTNHPTHHLLSYHIIRHSTVTRAPGAIPVPRRTDLNIYSPQAAHPACGEYFLPHARPGPGYPASRPSRAGVPEAMRPPAAGSGSTPCQSRAGATRRHAASGRRRRIAANGGAGREQFRWGSPAAAQGHAVPLVERARYRPWMQAFRNHERKI